MSLLACAHAFGCLNLRFLGNGGQRRHETMPVVSCQSILEVVRMGPYSPQLRSLLLRIALPGFYPVRCCILGAMQARTMRSG
jgi:hypothetical protein